MTYQHATFTSNTIVRPAVWLIIASLLAACESTAGEPGDGLESPEMPERAAPILDGTMVHDIQSEIVGDDYRIVVAMPREALPGPGDEPVRYPVIYVLDGNWAFAGAVGLPRLLSPACSPPMCCHRPSSWALAIRRARSWTSSSCGPAISLRLATSSTLGSTTPISPDTSQPAETR